MTIDDAVSSSAYCPGCQAPVAGDHVAACPGCGLGRASAGWPEDRRLGRTVAGGHYHVRRRLGSGGFGTVYLVETVVGSLKRALKVLHPEWAADPAVRQRFINEAIVLEQLNHPNIARCYAAGALDEAGGEPYLLLGFVDGVPLSSELTRDGAPVPLEPKRAVRLAKQIASGLVVVHANRVLHRDLKSQNVLVVDPGTSVERVKLVDFGIAGALGRDTETRVGTVGTPLCMAPEQLDLHETIDTRADLWQLGALLFEMLTGRPPYVPGSGGMAELLALHRQHADSGPDAGRFQPDLRAWPDLTRLVSRLLASDRGLRPASAAEVCEALARIEHQFSGGPAPDSALALLETLCAHPSERGWWAVCRHLATSDERDRLAAAAAPLLADWPEEWRRAPLAWWDVVKRGDAHPLWNLARRLDLSGLALDDAAAETTAANPALATITHLSLADNVLGPAAAAALARSSHLSALTALDLSHNRLGSDGVAHLAASPMLRRLARVNLAENGIGARGAAALAGGVVHPDSLDLSGNDLQTEGAAALAGAPWASSLRQLVLRDNAIGSDGLGALAVSRTLNALSRLDVSGNGIGPGGAAALALAPTHTGLRALELGRNALGLEGLQLLVASSRFSSLESLGLASNDIGAQGAMALASAPMARRLKRLDLSDNALGDAGLAALLGAPYLSGLRTLGMAQNGLTAAGVVLLGGAPPELADLDLSANAIGRPGAQALVATLPRLRLTTLSLADCDLDGAGLAAILAAAPALLTGLVVAGNPLTDDGARQLAATAPPVTLERLDVSRCGLGAEGWLTLAGWPVLSRLRWLTADSNGLGDARGPALAAATTRLSALECLRLRDNGLGAATCAALAASGWATRAVTLDLSLNELGDEGVGALLERGRWPALTELRLEQNAVGFGGAAALWSSPALPALVRAGLSRNAMAGLVDLHSLARRKVECLEDSFAKLTPRAADLAARFYARLFERYPSVKPLFAHTSMRRQQQHLVAALTLVIDNLRSPEQSEPHLRALGERHGGYGAFPSHYPAVTGVLVDTIREMLGTDWNDEIESAWHDGLDAVAAAMMQGARGR
ncbi:MAG: protein kinase [Vicinamibacterales bacterium]